MNLRKILDIYRTTGSTKEMAKRVADYLKEEISCDAISIFEFHEGSSHATLSYTTSKKNDTLPKFFGLESSIYNLFELDKDMIILHNLIKDKYQVDDTFFEDVSSVYSIAIAHIKDIFDKSIGLIRAINKHDLYKLTDFTQSDLIKMIDAANILGAAFVAQYSHNRAISFLDSVTHELLAPMTSVKNSAAFLEGYFSQKRSESESDQKIIASSSLNDIKRDTQASISLVQGLTMFSSSGRMSSSDLLLRPTHLKGIIERSIRNNLTFLRARNFNEENIICASAFQWPLFKFDRKIMIQVFTNIINNCIKYAYDVPKKFSIIISIKNIWDGGVGISIKDYGIGIEEESKKRIFFPGERGRRAKEAIPTGTGIGLTTVVNLLRAHGMSIELRSLDTPTEFYIRMEKDYVIRKKK